jgi:hypothetical protein
MPAASEHDPPHTGGENPGVDADVKGEGDEGRRAAEASPPIGDDAAQGQTQAPAPADDAGVPPDEVLAEEEESAG